MVQVERGSALAGWALAVALGLAGASALVLTPLARLAPVGRAGLRTRLRVLPFGVAERRVLAALDLRAGRPRAARDRLSVAVRRAPFDAGLRLERGEAALEAGALDGARHDAAAALRRAPVDARTCYRAALILLQADAAGSAVRALRCVVTQDPTRAVQVYELAHAVYADDGLVVRSIVPPDAEGARRFLGWAYQRGEREAAAAGWTALAARGATTADVVRDVDFLLGQGDVAAADERWTAAFGPRGPGIVFDGGFEREPVDGGFGWHLARTDGVRVQVAGGEAAAEGRHGLAIEFTGGNVDFSGVSQVVPVTAGRRYRLTALVRGAELTSLAGPHLEVSGDRSCPGLAPVAAPDVRGTTSWTPLRLEFTSPPACAAVVVRVRRTPATRLDRDLHGRFWLDDVRLADLGAAS